MHFLETAKSLHGISINAPESEPADFNFFTNNGHTPAIYNRGPLVGQPVSMKLGVSESWLFKLVLTTNGLIWIRDMTLKSGVVSSSLVYKASCIRPSHKKVFFDSDIGRAFAYEYCNTVLVSDLGHSFIDYSELVDYYFDLNEPERYLNSGLERHVCETALNIINRDSLYNPNPLLVTNGF